MLKGGIIRLLENKNILEIVLLAVVFATLLYEGSGFIGREISHSYPYGYLASDAFWHENVANYIKKEGSYKYHPPYMSAGYKDVVGFNPPLLYQLVASFSVLTGLEAYDAFYILIILLICFSAMAVYFVIKQFNSHVAMLSLPLFVFLFAKRFVIDVTWGQWIFISGGFFIIVFFWGMTKLELRHSYALLVIFIAALASAHQSEMVFAIGFIIIFIAIKSLSKKFDMSEIAPSHAPSFSSEKEGRFLSMLKNTLRPLGRGVFDIRHALVFLLIIIILIAPFFSILLGKEGKFLRDLSAGSGGTSTAGFFYWTKTPKEPGVGYSGYYSYRTMNGLWTLPFVLLAISLLLIKRERKELLLLSWLIALFILFHESIIGGRAERFMEIESYLLWPLVIIGLLAIPQFFKLPSSIKKYIKYSLVVLFLVLVISLNSKIPYEFLKEKAYPGLNRLTPAQYRVAEWLMKNTDEENFI